MHYLFLTDLSLAQCSRVCRQRGAGDGTITMSGAAGLSCLETHEVNRRSSRRCVYIQLAYYTGCSCLVVHCETIGRLKEGEAIIFRLLPGVPGFSFTGDERTGEFYVAHVVNRVKNVSRPFRFADAPWPFRTAAAGRFFDPPASKRRGDVRAVFTCARTQDVRSTDLVTRHTGGMSIFITWNKLVHTKRNMRIV